MHFVHIYLYQKYWKKPRTKNKDDFIWAGFLCQMDAWIVCTSRNMQLSSNYLQQIIIYKQTSKQFDQLGFATFYSFVHIFLISMIRSHIFCYVMTFFDRSKFYWIFCVIFLGLFWRNYLYLPLSLNNDLPNWWFYFVYF